MIEISGLDKYYDGNRILKSLNFSVSRGEIVSIIGRSGCGKTTLLKCVNLLEIPENGFYNINNTIFDFTNLNLAALKTRRIFSGQSTFLDKADYLGYELKTSIMQIRRKIALIFQSLNLFSNLNVLENVSLAPRIINGLTKEEATELAISLLNKLNLRDFEKRMPNSLSGGEAQRVAIARSLAMNPDVILFDEPTSALDPELISDFVELMKDLQSEGITQIIVTHQMLLARVVADRVMYMEDGELIECGTPEQIFDNPKDPKTSSYISKVLLR
ncbi:MAG: glutamine ABC transporter ATP-binding protein [Ignavibacteriae bacterium HGW-Ignavibacteriae-1]|nr:MAG: glutamine ABC transporter ATP-binding protein [Ignavibacteriae bacterium HGW-Ignavibacteriae-1]